MFIFHHKSCLHLDCRQTTSFFLLPQFRSCYSIWKCFRKKKLRDKKKRLKLPAFFSWLIYESLFITLEEFLHLKWEGFFSNKKNVLKSVQSRGKNGMHRFRFHSNCSLWVYKKYYWYGKTWEIYREKNKSSETTAHTFITICKE